MGDARRGRYAADTSVPADRSRSEIEQTLARYGASHFMYGWDEGTAVVAFRMGEEYGHRQIRFRLRIPTLDDREVSHTPTGQRRSAGAAEDARAKEERRRWRALLLVVKAKLEAVDSGIATFDEEFLSHIVLPSGETVVEWLRPDLEEAYDSGAMPSGLRLALTAGDGA